jgi:hypothetical protein
VAAHVDRKDRINPISTGTKIIPRSTRGTTTAATTIAAKVSIIPSISIMSSCLESTGTAGAVSVGQTGMGVTGYECRVLKTVTAWSRVDPLHSVLCADLAGQLPGSGRNAVLLGGGRAA